MSGLSGGWETVRAIGVYCDATYSDGRAAIAVVAAGGRTFGKMINCATSDQAEREAIQYARSMFSGPIYNDNSGACREEGAICIPRGENGRARRAAARIWAAEYRKGTPRRLEKICRGIVSDLIDGKPIDIPTSARDWMIASPRPDSWKFGSLWGDY